MLNLIPGTISTDLLDGIPPPPPSRTMESGREGGTQAVCQPLVLLTEYCRSCPSIAVTRALSPKETDVAIFLVHLGCCSEIEILQCLSHTARGLYTIMWYQVFAVLA